jgi:hypothetical protein
MHRGNEKRIQNISYGISKGENLWCVGAVEMPALTWGNILICGNVWVWNGVHSASCV